MSENEERKEQEGTSYPVQHYALEDPKYYDLQIVNEEH